MKNILSYFILLCLALFSFSCADKIEETIQVNTPEYMSYADLRSSVSMKSAVDIKQAGKIYFKDDFIFINEYQKGIHVINNADPASPQNISFIEIPGNVDMAVKGDKLYADSYIDLLTLDISDMNNITEVDRDTSVFPYIIPEFEVGILDHIDVSQGVITGYTVTYETTAIDRHEVYYQRFPMWEGEFFAMDATANGVKTSGSGTGGSMARFTLYDNYLYAIDNASLHLFDVSNNANPTFAKQIYISWQIETLFPYEQMLFIGAQSGMYIYSLQNPANPQFISEFRHATACDPVVVEGDYAYVTLRGGNLCGAIESQLDVIDISNMEAPKLVKEYPMNEPYGLGIDDDVLFICDGNDGLKIYDAGDPLTITDNQLAHYKDINAFDVIPLGDVLLMIGTDGLYQYDYSDLDDIKLLSHIQVYGK
ncbi:MULTISPECIES: LVIVD repeat-containing protein [unclassified Saccharicrinis]|uniref:LVIVD repeat-containing protein n=1 Tax=unclassified Saccharicrinis TaxID=2646859 RepID=UPI003D32A2A3